MIVVALALAAGWAVTVVALLGVIRAQHRQQARERGLLIDQILHLSGKPWHEAPAAHDLPPAEPDRTRRFGDRLEQQPVY